MWILYRHIDTAMYILFTLDAAMCSHFIAFPDLSDRLNRASAIKKWVMSKQKRTCTGWQQFPKSNEEKSSSPRETYRHIQPFSASICFYGHLPWNLDPYPPPSAVLSLQSGCCDRVAAMLHSSPPNQVSAVPPSRVGVGCLRRQSEGVKVNDGGHL